LLLFFIFCNRFFILPLFLFYVSCTISFFSICSNFAIKIIRVFSKWSYRLSHNYSITFVTVTPLLLPIILPETVLSWAFMYVDHLADGTFCPLVGSILYSPHFNINFTVVFFVSSELSQPCFTIFVTGISYSV
jgi:hypothetical protein